MLRFSLATFLLLVAMVSLFVAGLAFPNQIWRQIIGTTTLLVLLAGTIAAIAWQGLARWFWVGFAIAGWAYFAATFYGEEKGRDMLLTDYTLHALDDVLDTTNANAPSGERVFLHDDRVNLMMNRRMTQISLEEAEERGLLRYAYSNMTFPNRDSFHDIGHYAWTLLIGCLGGAFSLWLYRTSSKREAAERSSGQGVE